MGIVARQSFKASISNYLGVFLGFLNLFVLFPKYFDPTNLGALRLLLETGAVFSSFALLGTNYSINRFFPYFKTDDRQHNGFFFWAFSVPAFGYLLVMLGLIFFKEQILHLYKKDATLLNGLYPMLYVLVFFSLFQTVAETCNANHGRIAVPNFLREVLLRLLILAAGTAYYYEWIGFETSLWIMVASYGLVVTFNFIYLRQFTIINLKPDLEFLRHNKHIFRDAVRFTSYLFLGGVIGLVIGKLDFLMISARKSLDDTAVYSIGFYLALMIEIPKRTILQISNPIISHHMKDGNFTAVQGMYKQLTVNQLLIASILFFLIWLNIDSMYEIMPKGDYYQKGKLVVFIIGVSRLIDMIGSVSGPILTNSKFYLLGMVNFLVSFVVAVLANYYLIGRFGINGAALAIVATFLFNHTVTVTIIYIKMGMHPFSIKQLYIALVLLLFLIPTIWGKWLANPWLDMGVRSLVFGVPMVWAYYKLQVSAEFNNTLRKLLARLGLTLQGPNQA